MPKIIPLNHPDAKKYPFAYRKGDYVRTKKDSAQVGVVRDGLFLGNLEGPYQVTYVVELGDGQFFRAEESDLERVLSQ